MLLSEAPFDLKLFNICVSFVPVPEVWWIGVASPCQASAKQVGDDHGIGRAGRGALEVIRRQGTDEEGGGSCFWPRARARVEIFVECDKSPTSTMKSLKKLVSSLRTEEDSAVQKIDREFETDPL